MQNTPKLNKETIRPTTPQAIETVKTFLRTSRFAALACTSATTGRPSASRVALASDNDGTPIILVSALAPHTPSLLGNPFCSLLLGEIGKGDAMAYARATFHCTAVQVTRENSAYQRLRTRYLNHNPKGALYVDLGDFSFFRLEVDNVSLNGGFGKAFHLNREDVISDNAASIELAGHEPEWLEFLNQTYGDQINQFAHQKIKASSPTSKWIISAIDSDGFNLRSTDSVERILFGETFATSQLVKKQIISTLEVL